MNILCLRDVVGEWGEDGARLSKLFLVKNAVDARFRYLLGYLVDRLLVAFHKEFRRNTVQQFGSFANPSTNATSNIVSQKNQWNRSPSECDPRVRLSGR